MVEYFQGLPVENSFSDHIEIDTVLCECYTAFKQHLFPRVIELCGTSDALEVLVAAHSEDNLSLHVLCRRQSWNKVLARIKKLPTQAAVVELFSLDELGRTALYVAAEDGTVEVWRASYYPSGQAGRQEEEHPGHR